LSWLADCLVFFALFNLFYARAGGRASHPDNLEQLFERLDKNHDEKISFAVCAFDVIACVLLREFSVAIASELCVFSLPVAFADFLNKFIAAGCLGWGGRVGRAGGRAVFVPEPRSSRRVLRKSRFSFAPFSPSTLPRGVIIW
jgi:hypothetical protein